MMVASKKKIFVSGILTAIGFFLAVASVYPREDLWQRLNAEIMKLSREGNYPEAIYVAQNSIKLAEKTFGAQDPRVAASMNNLATLYRIVGRYDDAEAYYIQSLTIRENALGPQHRQVATSQNNLAGLYRARGRLDEAELLYLRALKIRKMTLGPDHPEAAAVLANLAALYKAQKDFAAAEPLYQRALAISATAGRPELLWPIQHHFSRLLADLGQDSFHLLRALMHPVSGVVSGALFAAPGDEDALGAGLEGAQDVVGFNLGHAEHGHDPDARLSPPPEAGQSTCAVQPVLAAEPYNERLGL